ncbi:glycoside hydrolase family 16 protein [Bifidobacterium longum]|uniref:Glycoside hydrolase family 16 protein n=1 Tax=Bifidobacterium longum subsp. longum TaxID=1679 RepID=A0A9Q8QW79_BIFLL|nr:glycoside hydrolase family 16 protein [Bifidobacterium longum]UNL66324.1 glycoside hydrolase family 16 protein [Bifidobacterium longum subsp. longum]UNL68317.1 glycoside hydrolase family 16 protein [Bifidobacterium longum subsp. longum]UNL70170.1 glycoside hydrolase family 16 protein [Bifidobacterium longum subsp. longum]UNL71581.1 glycoside hydrolase family 16 protein [Bifidobacterium longum subsp. longum]UNL82581.1 glycoside hydrolase family 16 protein [Bifidobacterium longum subsp. longu
MQLRKNVSRAVVAVLAAASLAALPCIPAHGEESGQTANVGNVLLGKQPTTNSTNLIDTGMSTVPQVTILNPAAATDGTYADLGDNASTRVNAGAETGGEDNGYAKWDDVYLQYDLGENRSITAVNLYHNGYENAVSIFKQVKVEVSNTADFSQSTVISGPADYEETTATHLAAQKIVPTGGQIDARYVRIWQRGHYIRNTNSSWTGYSNGVQFREIEVLAKLKDSETPPAQEELRNIALGKTPYVYGLAPTNIAAINDGKMDSNYAVHNSLGLHWLQFEYKNTYRIRKIVVKLEPGTYDSIRVSIASTPSSRGTAVYEHSNVTVDKPIVVETDMQGSDVRFTVNRNASSPTKYSEVQIWATGNSYDESRTQYVSPESKYDTLAWSDEFNGDSIDESKWNIIDGMANHGAIYNRDAVGITKDGDNSYLAINTKNYVSTQALKQAVGYDDYGTQLNEKKVTWSSGRLESKNKYSFQNGRMAVRAKVNDSQGIWPAIWMLSQDETGHDEIDVLEYLGQDPWTAWTTNHFGILDKNKQSDGKANTNWEAWSQAFHVYEVEWSPERINWYIDGRSVFTSTRGRDDGRDGMHTRPMFPILETQVGDGWVGDVDYSRQNTKQNSDFLVDWVRVYQRADQDQVRFDDLEGLSDAKQFPAGAYRIGSSAATDGLETVSNGSKQWQNKNNFFYEGQPRYETNRVMTKEDADADQSITWFVPGVKDAHLTAYYQTIYDRHAWSNAANGWHGYSIRSGLNDGANIDFRVETSKDGATWEPAKVSVVDNYIADHPAYARTTFDAYSLPEGTKYVRAVFPNLNGVTYSTAAGRRLPVLHTDVQLAKATFLQSKEHVNDVEQTDTPSGNTGGNAGTSGSQPGVPSGKPSLPSSAVGEQHHAVGLTQTGAPVIWPVALSALLVTIALVIVLCVHSRREAEPHDE